jgi:hypothetical protein
MNPSKHGYHALKKSCEASIDCAGPGPVQVQNAVNNLQKMAFVGITELWDLSLCLFHRLHGAPLHAGDLKVSNQQSGSGAVPRKYTDPNPFVDIADEILFSSALDRYEADLECVLQNLESGETQRCAVPKGAGS